MPKKDGPVLQNYTTAVEYEWLETNGLGGWAGSTIIGANTRRYHGLLIAAIVPPTERMALVSRFDETIIIGDNKYELGTRDYGNTIQPDGYRFLKAFARDFFPEFIYEAGGIKLKKIIGMIHEENTVIIIYDILEANEPFTMELLPLFSGRGYHQLQHFNNNINPHAIFENDILQLKAYAETPTVFIKVPGGQYYPGANWLHNLNYSVEHYRGQDFTEDLFTPGRMSINLKKGDSLGVIISIDNPVKKDAHELLAKERVRRESLLKNQPAEEMVRQLVLAADQFIVKRTIKLPAGSQVSGKESEGATVIAGYHWFTDWGRDTMISLPGLCLSTGRFEDARKIITAFAQNLSRGMLPNRFPDNDQEPEYNNVDGTLWYFIAIYKYFQATSDRDFISKILPVLKDIIDWHFKGTRYNIRVDADGLLYAGEKGQQLTWMDAKIGDWVVTPRMGKPVEIQALWYNALKIFAELLRLNDHHHEANFADTNAEKTKQSFTDKFWYDSGKYLYDVIDENGKPDSSLRPNQLFAISLPYALLEGEKATAVLEIVEKELYTPVGLRSLPRNDTHYVHNYGGDAYTRDASYHQGTVWSWLLGPYVDAMIKVKIQNSKVKKVIENFGYHLNEGCIGSVAEIFDADLPHHPRGCVAQAWGVAELLRIMKEYELYDKTG